MEVYGLLIPVLKKRVWFWILLAFFPKREGVCYCSIWDLWTLALLFIENNIVVFPYIDVTTLSWMCFPCPKWIIKDKGNHLEGHVLTIA